MDVCSLLLAVIAAVALSTAHAVSIDHDKVQPFAQPEPATVSEKAAVKYKPSLQIIDGCHPYPAVNAAGETSSGLKGTGELDGECKGSGLGSQVYGRAVWYKDLWAIMYSWYFPKDMYYDFISKKGHRHKWVNAVVWLDNPALDKPKILAVSTSTTSNDYGIMKNGPPECDRQSCAPAFVEYTNDTSAMLSYILVDYGNSLSMTTVRGVGEVQDLIMWEQLTEEARTALSETDFGEDAKVPFIDANLKPNLEMARPFL
ncbi:unnamed protein product [Phytophthora fragariaefolia]|uniref:Unnamed protein product n=1 Tax=Phytophthora fragariaefolia TaxID=1490495 RepID=A0A9W6TT38_9STRA|nr:unnamed protein product [Phytophthora fragariaefolia]